MSRITSVSVRRLVSGPGYNNNAIEVSAQVEDGDDPATVREQLTQWIDDELMRIKAIERLSSTAIDLAHQVKNLEDRRDYLKPLIDRGEKIITGHEKLRDLAQKNGLGYLANLGDELPF